MTPTRQVVKQSIANAGICDCTGFKVGAWQPSSPDCGTAVAPGRATASACGSSGRSTAPGRGDGGRPGGVAGNCRCPVPRCEDEVRSTDDRRRIAHPRSAATSPDGRSRPDPPRGRDPPGVGGGDRHRDHLSRLPAHRPRSRSTSTRSCRATLPAVGARWDEPVNAGVPEDAPIPQYYAAKMQVARPDAAGGGAAGQPARAADAAAQPHLLRPGRHARGMRAHALPR